MPPARRPCGQLCYSESPQCRAEAHWSWSNNCVSSRKSRDFRACISSRITTVIHVIFQHAVNRGRFNEPFAVSLKKVVLRRAWLNLWDKHMTTGRINQVAIGRIALVRATAYQQKFFAFGSVSTKLHDFSSTVCWAGRDPHVEFQLTSTCVNERHTRPEPCDRALH
jgi:hypothetical protein